MVPLEPESKMRLSKFFHPSLKKKFCTRGPRGRPKCHIARPEVPELIWKTLFKFTSSDAEFQCAHSVKSSIIPPMGGYVVFEKNWEKTAKKGCVRF